MLKNNNIVRSFHFNIQYTLLLPAVEAHGFCLLCHLIFTALIWFTASLSNRKVNAVSQIKWYKD